MGCVVHAADLKIQVEPAFVGFGPANGVAPIAVTLKNLGPDARGSLHLSSGNFNMEYPIELPRGSVKRLVTYPIIDVGSEIGVELSTNQGKAHTTYRQFQFADANSQTVLLIGDTEGDLIFLRTRADQSQMWDAYVKPELAPDRPIAFGGMSAVVLGPGAERLSDESVHALHSYVAKGGTVAFFGGASSPTLTDKRWSDVIPVRAGLPKKVSDSELLSNLDDHSPGAFTILDSTPVEGAAARREGDHVILARRDIGLGKTVFLAFNPLEPPFTRWPGKRLLFSKILHPIDSARAKGYLDAFQTSLNDNEPRPYTPYSSTSSMQYPPAADPFSTELPPTGRVLWILVGYFVAIIPVNFLLLKKLKKGELAWFTAPLISVAFAGAFFAAAKDLYSAKLSRATQGLIVATQAGTDDVFIGRSQMFFPQGGEFDLKMAGVESIGPARSPYDYYYGYRRQADDNALDDLNPVDVGHVVISHMDVNNLAFRELAYQQISTPSRWVKVDLNRETHKLTLTNISSYDLADCSAIVAGETFQVAPHLAPHSSKTVSLPASISRQVVEEQTRGGPAPYSGGPQPALQYRDLAEITSQTKEIVVKAVVSDAPVGPLVGSAVGSRQNIMLAFFSGMHYGKEEL